MWLDAVSRRRFLTGAASFIAVQRLTRAQQPTYTTDVRVVNVLATVRNKHGQIVSDLKKEDFLLEEDGRPQEIKYFTRESDLPLTLGLLVDTSGSQRRVIGAERTASHRFLNQVLREDKDQAFVIHFDFEVELLEDLTSSRKLLEAALDKLEVPEMQRPQWGGPGRGGYPSGPGGGGPPRGGRRRRGGTSMFDAVLLASDDIMSKQSGRKALILLSDGVDNGSRTSLGTSVESAQRANSLVYSILFKDDKSYPQRNYGGPGWGGRRRGGGPGRGPQNPPDGKKVLEQVSRDTGGGFFEVTKKQSIEQIYAKIEEDLRNQYSLGFSSDRKDGGGFRRIHLVTRDKSLTVQTRDGYYPAAS